MSTVMPKYRCRWRLQMEWNRTSAAIHNTQRLSQLVHAIMTNNPWKRAPSRVEWWHITRTPASQWIWREQFLPFVSNFKWVSKLQSNCAFGNAFRMWRFVCNRKRSQWNRAKLRENRSECTTHHLHQFIGRYMNEQRPWERSESEIRELNNVRIFRFVLRLNKPIRDKLSYVCVFQPIIQISIFLLNWKAAR